MSLRNQIPLDGRSDQLAGNSLGPDSLFLGSSFQRFYAFTEPLILRELREGDRLLDVGCGDGGLALRLLTLIPLRVIIGLDTRSEAIETARSLAPQNGTAQFWVGDAQDLDWVRQFGPFDVILARTSLHHFHDPIVVLRGYAAMIPKGGKLILIDIDRESACMSLLGFPSTLLITWVTVIKTLGWRSGWSAIRWMRYPSKEWRQHRAADMAHRREIGWYHFRDIRAKLQSAFPSARIGRLASLCGLGGVHYMVYEKVANA